MKHRWTATTSEDDGSVRARCSRCRLTRWQKFEGAVRITAWKRPSDSERSYSAIPACRAAAAKKPRAA